MGKDIPCLVSPLITLDLHHNKLSGTMDEQAWRHKVSLSRCFLHNNRISGAIPDAFWSLTALSTVSLHYNALTGVLPESASWDARRIRGFRVHRNRLAGALPEVNVARMTDVKLFILQENSFAGSLPQHSIGRMTALTDFSVTNNCFAGALPEVGLRGHPRLVNFHASVNKLSGTLPEAALHPVRIWVSQNRLSGSVPECSAPSKLKDLWISENLFIGTLPRAGLRAMSLLWRLSVYLNHFTGTLPSDGLRGMLALGKFVLNTNHFAGTVPEFAFAAKHSLSVFSAATNFFQGALPDAVSSCLALVFFEAASTLIEGEIPALLGKSQHDLHLVTLQDLSLHGVVPGGLGRISHPSIVYVLGHGLEGICPRFAGTLLAFSIFRNGLRGRLPELHLRNDSRVIVHLNSFSCKLPWNGGVSSALSFALVGNHFHEPRVWHSFPPWVCLTERTDFFCVSNRPARFLLLKTVCGFLALLCGLFLRSSFGGVSVLAGTLANDRLRALRVAFNSCVHLQRKLVVFTCPAACSYPHSPALMCTMVLSRLQIQLLHAESHVPYILEVKAWLMILGATLQFHRLHGTLVRRTSQVEWDREENVRVRPRTGTLWNVWLLSCLIVSTPAAMYSFLYAIPGFLGASFHMGWLVNQAVSIFTSAMTAFWLPRCAGILQNTFGSPARGHIVELLLVGKLVVIPMVPTLVTIVCHADCLGSWVVWWEPCRTRGSVQDKPTLDAMARVNVDLTTVKATSRHQLLTRHDLCAIRSDLLPSKCASTVLERIVPLVLGHTVNLAFAAPTLQCIFGRPIKCSAAWVLLAFNMLLTLMLGPCVPMLLPYSVLVLLIHRLLLSSSLKLVPRMGKEDMDACLPTRSLRTAIFFALLLQLCVIRQSLPYRSA